MVSSEVGAAAVVTAVSAAAAAADAKVGAGDRNAGPWAARRPGGRAAMAAAAVMRSKEASRKDSWCGARCGTDGSSSLAVAACACRSQRGGEVRSMEALGGGGCGRDRARAEAPCMTGGNDGEEGGGEVA